MIEGIVPGTRARLAVLRAVLENEGTTITGLIQRTGVSPNTVIAYVDRLVAARVLREDRIGGVRKTHIRQLYVRTDSEFARSIIALVELDRRLALFETYRYLRSIMEHLVDVLGERAMFVLVYGSHARLAATPESDLDLLVVGGPGIARTRGLADVFVTLEAEHSLRTMSPEEFREKRGTPFLQTILRDHVVIAGMDAFLKELV
ncbi:MAG: winged helix-turn-helix transcriptional regulator [Candidatus Undinarchaeales archaeon]|jgi:predicted nucleotidyltransferase|nr:winged helix-turn-helix transcriptional regulator [Candidatus Undinarchaeales archaeon]MDP7494414.1 winged helix-turn-helix transcriptional regulator [Candidatus Undinarchaeales archaeon]